MASGSLLMLLDDIATLLDDVSVMTKIAAKKTAGVLGDDLAVNAEKVSGVQASRELPVIWAVAKGSFKNKLVLVPAALAISVFIPWLITPLLMLGGMYLCYEGFEKIAHYFLHDKTADTIQHEKNISAIADPEVDMVAFEQEKIKGAIRTDFVLSAEIIVITLGTVKDATFAMQAAVVTAIAIIMTVGIYGLVAGIIKLDDGGLLLLKSTAQNSWGRFKRWFGMVILAFAPYLMKTLAIVGTAAMFLVGGGILAHSIPEFHTYIEQAEAAVKDITLVGGVLEAIIELLIHAILGILCGAVVLIVVNMAKHIKGSPEKAA